MPSSPSTPEQRAAAAERQRRSRANRRAAAGLPPVAARPTPATALPANRKACPACKNILHISSFAPTRHGGVYPYCRCCHATKSNAYYHANKARIALVRKYGLQAVRSAEATGRQLSPPRPPGRPPASTAR